MDDIRPAYAVFRRSLFDYLFRQSLMDETTAKDPPIESDWRRQSAWIEHLWASAAENWVAQDAAGCIVGWAMSVERDSHLELTHFFVDPGVQAKGIGRSLIQRAFPHGATTCASGMGGSLIMSERRPRPDAWRVEPSSLARKTRSRSVGADLPLLIPLAISMKVLPALIVRSCSIQTWRQLGILAAG